MPVGTHNFKFIVDDEWKCSEDLPTASDPEGNLINYLQVSKEASHAQGDGLDDLTLNDLEMTRGRVYLNLDVWLFYLLIRFI
jgi:hypothetical protein